MIAEGLGALTQVMTVARGPHWNIAENRIQRVGVAWAAVIEHYFPNETIAETSLLAGAIMATGATFGPPLVVDMAKARAAAATRAATPRQRPQPQYTAPPAPEPYWTAPQPQRQTVYEPEPMAPAYEPPPPSAPQPGDLPNMSEADLAQMAAIAQQAMQMMGLFSANGNSDPTGNSENADPHSPN